MLPEGSLSVAERRKQLLEKGLSIGSVGANSNTKSTNHTVSSSSLSNVSDNHPKKESKTSFKPREQKVASKPSIDFEHLAPGSVPPPPPLLGESSRSEVKVDDVGAVKAAEPSNSSVAETKPSSPSLNSESTNEVGVSPKTQSPTMRGKTEHSSHISMSAPTSCSSSLLPNNEVVVSNLVSSVQTKPPSKIEPPLQTNTLSCNNKPKLEQTTETCPETSSNPKDEDENKPVSRGNRVASNQKEKAQPSSNSPPKKRLISSSSTASSHPLLNNSESINKNTEKKDPPIVVICSNNRSNIINTIPNTSSAKNLLVKGLASSQSTPTSTTSTASQPQLSETVVENKNTISNPNYVYPNMIDNKMNPNSNDFRNNSIQYPSAPSFEEIEHHFPEYQPTMMKTTFSTSDIAVEAQMQTMARNSFTPISDTLSSSSDNSEDYKMFTQFKEFIQIQQPQSVHMNEEQLYELFLSFKERYEAQNNVNRQQATGQMNPNMLPVNNQIPQQQQPILLNKSRVPVGGRRDSSSTSSTRSAPSNPNVPEKKRDGFKDVRRKYEAQYMEQIRLQQIKERNRDHFAQQFQAPVMDYNALIQRENGVTNNIGNPNNYPVVNPNVNSGDVITNGNYIPFQTNPSNNPSTTVPTWSEYLTFGYWK